MTVTTDTPVLRHFVTYTGVKLPLKLLDEVPESGLSNRNTFFRGWFDAEERVVKIEKSVYGEVELRHSYDYHPNGRVAKAVIELADEQTTVMTFDEDGGLLSSETSETDED
ncbi:DUF6156 family protein [Derxia gummosa]|uniref:DUF6156 family protein n=1 Tax=Derxia gummosa DSM 723 TaxID=1121388 RepID=A0A8B6X852_9BURK|nr:DUF6156 family protein [Derxia gummosa]